jgi:hypothetical protein
MVLNKKNSTKRMKRSKTKRKTRSKRGGTKPKNVAFIGCNSDFECPMEALHCDLKNNICVQKGNPMNSPYNGGKTRKNKKKKRY